MYERKTEKNLNTPFDHVIDLLSGKWNSRIISSFVKHGTLRYVELRSLLSGISDPVLSSALKRLQQEEIIFRRQYREVPLRVEYGLTPRGNELARLCKSICKWGYKYYPPASEEDRLF